ncbi:NAD(+) synthase [Blattabacterium cuenoti]|uniref:NAD(+) synthase n=1 Tax=Blattabacterium cuenoti TaxID=1653831 RepID=UPI00163B9852|nr:NAD(+) synthase [Blattabacterium cuenoti]
MIKIKVNKIISYIVSWLKEYIKNSYSKGFVIGISGGIDSSVTSVLTSMTGIPTMVIEIPIIENRNILAKKHAKFLLSNYSNVFYLKKDLHNFFNFFCKNIAFKNHINNDLALANVQSRMRMIMLYYYANLNNYIVVGTGNKIEDFGIGFFTKYGDGGVDIQPIADLNKSEIRLLAKELNIISEIQKAKPTDGLWKDNRSDEEQIGLSYDNLEWAMNIMLFKKNNNIFSKNKIIKKYKYLHSKNKHKIDKIPICNIPSSYKEK